MFVISLLYDLSFCAQGDGVFLATKKYVDDKFENSSLVFEGTTDPDKVLRKKNISAIKSDISSLNSNKASITDVENQLNKTNSTMQERVKNIVTSMGLPTSSGLSELTTKVDSLSTSVSSLDQIKDHESDDDQIKDHESDDDQIKDHESDHDQMEGQKSNDAQVEKNHTKHTKAIERLNIKRMPEAARQILVDKSKEYNDAPKRSTLRKKILEDTYQNIKISVPNIDIFQIKTFFFNNKSKK